MFLQVDTDKIVVEEINKNSKLFVNQRNGSWFICNAKDADTIHKYFSSRLSVSNNEASDIEDMLKCVRFFEDLVPSKSIQEATKKFTSFIISVTRDCNLHCAYCWANANEVNADIPLETIKVFADKILHKKYCSDVVRFQFSGGEPTIKIDLIDEAITYIKDMACTRGIEVLFQIQTNAFSLHQPVIDIVKKHNIGIGVTIDQLNPDRDTGRVTKSGRKSTEAVNRNVENLVNQGIKPVILTTLSSYNCADIHEIPIFMKKLGIENMRIIPLIVGRGGEESFQTMKAETDAVIGGVKQLIDVIYELNTEDSSFWIYDLHISQYVRKIMYDRDIYYPCAQSPCGAGRQVLSLFANGDIFPCDGFHRYDMFKCGNILHDDLDEILRAQPIQSIAIRNSKHMDGCVDCAYNNYCIGGCIQEVEMTSDDLSEIMKPSEYCKYYKQLFAHLFGMVDEGKDLMRLLRRI